MSAQKLFAILQTQYGIEYTGFVTFWKAHYNYPKSSLYSENIRRHILTEENIHELFKWKNGMNLSAKKNSLLSRILVHVAVINSLRTEMNNELFETTFTNMPSIWKIFLRHIIDPERSPIFDQHVYRAFRFIQDQEIDELKNHKDKERIYYEQYLPFYMDLVEHCSCTSKEIDEALWAFGKFLSLYPKMFIKLRP